MSPKTFGIAFMHIEIPLVPVCLEVGTPAGVHVRRRRLRPFRLSTRGWMVVVALSALVLGLLAEVRRSSLAINEHAAALASMEKMRKTRGIGPPIPRAAWRSAYRTPTEQERLEVSKLEEARAAFDRVDFLALVAVSATLALATVFSLGRILNRVLPVPTVPAPGDVPPSFETGATATGV